MVLSLIGIFKTLADFTYFALGTLQTPYVTYRTLAQRKDIRHVVYIAFLVIFYLLIAGFIKGGLSKHPLILTTSFVRIVAAISLSYTLSVGLIGFLGGLFGGEVNWKRIAVLWAYSLLPTTCWFITASLFSFILPPPRSMTFAGQLAGIFFISLSVALFLWKGMLYYLTVRFGLRLDLVRIVAVSGIFLPLTATLAFFLYQLRVFRVPFI